jgi:hypothetical protein
MRVRKYKSSDRNSVRDICSDTGLLGDPIDPFMPDRKLWADANSSYYTDIEPESLFILEDKGTILGYLFGCVDSRKEMAYRTKIAPKIFFRILINILAARHLAEIRRLFKWALTKYKLEMPGFPHHYAHLHINLIRDKRAKGWGSKLMKEYFKYLRKKGVEGVFAQVFRYGPQKSFRFFTSLGMKEFEERSNTLWKDFILGEVKLVTVVKRL